MSAYDEIFEDENKQEETTNAQVEEMTVEEDSLQFDTIMVRESQAENISQAKRTSIISKEDSIDFAHNTIHSKLQEEEDDAFFQESMDLGVNTNVTTNTATSAFQESIDFADTMRRDDKTPTSALCNHSVDFNSMPGDNDSKKVDNGRDQGTKSKENEEQSNTADRVASPLLFTENDQKVDQTVNDEEEEDEVIIIEQTGATATKSKTDTSEGPKSIEDEVDDELIPVIPKNIPNLKKVDADQNKTKAQSESRVLTIEDEEDDELIPDSKIQESQKRKSGQMMISEMLPKKPKRRREEEEPIEPPKKMPRLVQTRITRNSVKQSSESSSRDRQKPTVNEEERMEEEGEHEITFDDTEDYRDQVQAMSDDEEEDDFEDGYNTPEERIYKRGGYGLRVTPNRKRKGVKITRKSDDSDSPVIEISSSDSESKKSSSFERKEGRRRLKRRRKIIDSQVSSPEEREEEKPAIVSNTDDNDLFEESQEANPPVSKTKQKENKLKTQKRKEALEKLVQNIGGSSKQKRKRATKEFDSEDPFEFNEDDEIPAGKRSKQTNYTDNDSMDSFIVPDDVALTQYTSDNYYESSEEDEPTQKPSTSTQQHANLSFDDEESQLLTSPVITYVGPGASMSEKESFKVVIQFLASCLLDEGFEAYIQNVGNETYFKPAMRKIFNPLDTRKTSLVSSSVWTHDFLEDVHQYPTLACSYSSNHTDCEICRRTGHPATANLRFSGKALDQRFYTDFLSATEKYVDSSDDEKNYLAGSNCQKRVLLYHTMHHYKYFLKRSVSRLLKTVQRSDAPEAIAAVLESQHLPELYTGYERLLKIADRYSGVSSRHTDTDLDSYRDLFRNVFPLGETEETPVHRTPKKPSKTKKNQSTAKFNQLVFVKKASTRDEKKKQITSVERSSDKEEQQITAREDQNEEQTEQSEERHEEEHAQLPTEEVISIEEEVEGPVESDKQQEQQSKSSSSTSGRVLEIPPDDDELFDVALY